MPRHDRYDAPTSVAGPTEHYLGQNLAHVTLIEYGDYTCTRCAQAHDIVTQLRSQIGDRIRFGYRNFPLDGHQARTCLAAEAAEAAAEQGRFWSMHDLLFERQDALELEDLLDYADELHLDFEAFRQALETHRFRDRVHADFQEGWRLGIRATPAFLINGVLIDTWNYERLQNALLAAIDASPFEGPYTL